MPPLVQVFGLIQSLFLLVKARHQRHRILLSVANNEVVHYPQENMDGLSNPELMVSLGDCWVAVDDAAHSYSSSPCHTSSHGFLSPTN